MSLVDQPISSFGERVRGIRISRRLPLPLVLPVVGIIAWIIGVSRLRPVSASSYGLLASANVWFLLGIGLLLCGFVLELARSNPRGWLLTLELIALIVAIHATVPIVYHTPEYAWVYKHVGIASAFAQYGRETDPANIYDQWPAFFTAVASVSSLSHVAVLRFATWAPLAFELADALLLMAVFRSFGLDRRVPYLAVALYEGLIAWVGQDYLSPQAFSYLLWLAMAVIILRVLRRPPQITPSTGRLERLGRLRAALLDGLPAVPKSGRPVRATSIVLVLLLDFAIVAAHQLTPYVVLSGIAGLTIIGVVRPRWLVLALAIVTGAYLVPHLGLISKDFGGLFSGGNPIQNASGAAGTHHAGPEAATAGIVRALAGVMWLTTLGVVLLRRRSFGRVIIPAVLAFSPFVILGAQSYGGEAIYRVFLFSAPWCALLIAGGIYELPLSRRVAVRTALTALACVAFVFAGLQGLYGAVAVNAFTPRELTASRWLYSHVARGSLIVLPVDNFPALQVADYNKYEIQVMPADPQLGESWLDEGNLTQVRNWIADLGHRTAYIVVSPSMSASAEYFGAPRGYARLVRTIPSALGGSVVYRNGGTTIYRMEL
jgi:hypothetical protein